MNIRYNKLFLENTQWTEDMIHISKRTEYKTEIGLRCSSKINCSDSVCFEEKKMLRFFSNQRLTIHLCYYL